MVNVPPGVPGVDGAYVATAELILDGTAHHIDLAPFAPGRLRRSTRQSCGEPEADGTPHFSSRHLGAAADGWKSCSPLTV